MSTTTKPDANTTNAKSEHPIHGARNLFVLGVVAISLAVISTAISLYIYHATGDIYLDRSRPGFIFEDETVGDTAGENTTYSFSPDGEINRDTLSEYLDELDKVIEEVDAASSAFSADPLSDESLGITSQSASDEPSATE